MFFGFFAPKFCGILDPWPETELMSPALKGEVLTTGPQGSPWISL